MKIVLEARFPKYIYHQICDPVHSTLLAVQVLEELGSKQALNSLQKSTQNGFATTFEITLGITISRCQ